MADASLEFGDVFVEEMGVLYPVRVKVSDNSLVFKNENTGKVHNIANTSVKSAKWTRLGNKPGLYVSLEDGDKVRFGGFKDSDFEKINSYLTKHWDVQVEPQELSLKGWNYGQCKVNGKSIEFVMDSKPVFDVPLSNVSNCVGNKSEATLEFHMNDDCTTNLIEMRLHMPSNPDDDEDDPVEEFRQAVMAFAGIENETGQPIASLSQILCMTPRGRYDIKIYPNHLSLHGKTYDYKIPIKTIMRLFLVPNKDGRRVYFVISLNPPIRQGQTRYHYLVFEFLKEEEIELELGLTDDQIAEQYNGKLERDMSGPLYEVVSKIFRVLINMKITVPGNFIGHSGTPAVQCAHKQASGTLYPLEKGFLYIPKPPMYIRFEEVVSVHFARSDVSTRSFDFEIEMRDGPVLVFNSVEKDEYNKLYDYMQNKNLRIRNAKKMTKKYTEDQFAGSDDELDPYKEAVKAEGKERGDDDSDSDSEDDEYDLDKDLEERRKKREENSSEGSGSEPDEEFDSDASSDAGSGSETEKPKKRKKEKDPSSPKKKTTKASGDKKEKKTKDPNAPKRPQSAYFLWLSENRANIKKDGDSVTDIAKRAGELWRGLSSDDKKPFEEKAAEDKERYEQEIKKYRAEGGGVPAKSSTSKSPKKSSGPSPSKAKSKEYISDSDDSDEDEGKKEKVKEKPKKKPAAEVKKEDSDEEDSDDSDSD